MPHCGGLWGSEYHNGKRRHPVGLLCPNEDYMKESESICVLLHLSMLFGGEKRNASGVAVLYIGSITPHRGDSVCAPGELRSRGRAYIVAGGKRNKFQGQKFKQSLYHHQLTAVMAEFSIYGKETGTGRPPTGENVGFGRDACVRELCIKDLAFIGKMESYDAPTEDRKRRSRGGATIASTLNGHATRIIRCHALHPVQQEATAKSKR